MFSYQLSSWPHRRQRDPGRTTDSPTGNRNAHTLRKLPTTRPKRPVTHVRVKSPVTALKALRRGTPTAGGRAVKCGQALLVRCPGPADTAPPRGRAAVQPAAHPPSRARPTTPESGATGIDIG